MKKIMKKMINGALLIILLASVTGCTTAARNKMMLNSMKPLMDSMDASIKRSTDFDLIRKGMPAGLIQMDGMIELVPDDQDLLVRAAEANFGYAFSFLESENKPLATRYYKKSRDYALRALQLNGDFKAAFDQPVETFSEALETFRQKDVPALYYAASSWLLWIKHYQGNERDVLSDLPKIRALMERLICLDHLYKYGAVHVLWGTYYANQPVMFGGDPQKAQFHFQHAFEISESKYLLWQVLYARYYALQVRDKALFVTTLNRVVSAPDNLLPGHNFENGIAKIKAQELLSDVNAYF